MKANSIPRLCERLQRSPAAVETVIDKLGIVPSIELDGKQFFDADSEIKIGDRLAEQEVKSNRHKVPT